MLRDYLTISVRSLASRKTRTYLTMIGIFIGIASVVALIGLGEGLRLAISSQFGFLGTDVLSIQASGLNFAGPPGAAVANPLTGDLTDKIKKVKGVETVINRYLESAPVEFNDKQVISIVYSMPDGTDRQALESMVNIKAMSGRMLKDGDGKKVMLGHDFTKELSFGKDVAVGDRILIKGIEFEVVGLLEKKGSFILDSSIGMNEDVLIELFKNDNTINAIAVKVKDEKEINDVKSGIEKLLRKEREVKEGEEDFVVESPQSVLDSLDSTLFAVQMFVIIIALISIVVGGIGITNTMYTAVLERTKEIGIMKAIGARNSIIFTLFFIESGLLGLIGGIIGILLGLGFAYGSASAGRALLGVEIIRAHVPTMLIVMSLMFSVIIGLLAGIIPAYRASRKTPIDSLRYAK
ncbi:ABC transporter permease [Candidatus Woesearchaeota archaeon]|nr:ABC transporter permease [Candidatus Woesearchaeota archaeon]